MMTMTQLTLNLLKLKKKQNLNQEEQLMNFQMLMTLVWVKQKHQMKRKDYYTNIIPFTKDHQLHH